MQPYVPSVLRPEFPGALGILTVPFGLDSSQVASYTHVSKAVFANVDPTII